MKLDLDFTLYIKAIQNGLRLMISPEIIKLLEKKRRREERFHDLNLGKDFTDMTPKHRYPEHK